MIDQLLQYDTELFQFLNGLGSETWDQFWRIVTLKWSSIPLYLLLLYLIQKQLGWKATGIILLTIAVMIACTDQLANVFKHGFKRPRPCQVEALKETIRYVAKGCGRYGYFSAHAASSMAVAVFVGLLLKRWYAILPFAILFWAVFVAYSRVYLGVHYPLDIITGMAIGALIGLGGYKLQGNLRTRFKIN